MGSWGITIGICTALLVEGIERWLREDIFEVRSNPPMELKVPQSHPRELNRFAGDMGDRTSQFREAKGGMLCHRAPAAADIN